MANNLQPPVLFKEDIFYKMEDGQRHLFFSYNNINGDKRMQNPHLHSFYEVYYLDSGSVSYLIEGQLFNLSGGEVALIKPSTLHKTLYPNDSKNVRYLIGFNELLLNYMDDEEKQWLLSVFESATPVIKLKGELLKRWRKLILDIHFYAKSKKAGRNIRILSNFQQAMILLKDNGDHESEVLQNDKNLDDKMIAVMAYIHEHYNEHLSLEDIAHNFYISLHYLCHKFKEVTGFTVIEYIHQIRVQKAQDMLLHTTERILEISEECGFGSVSQFNRVFKKHCGISASQYRKINSETKT